MGAWGIGNFENDSGLDFLYEVEENLSLDFLINTINECITEDYMEVDLASAGLVAIEIISAGLGNPSNDFEVDNNISSFIKEELANQIGKEHLVLCSKLLNKILDDDSNDFMTLGGKR